MHYKNILITGGAGFIGSNLALKLKSAFPKVNILALDNLKRRGSELNIPRLKAKGVEFIHGDIRCKEDLTFSQKIDLLIECSADPSVLAGINNSPEYIINTNLLGTINCLEVARKDKADIIFLSTSRVYPLAEIEGLAFREMKTRFEFKEKQAIAGVSAKGIAENFPLGKARSLYGTTKLCSEFMLMEYFASYGLKGVINRCGVVAGPWQMGKIDQGVATLWMARHIWPEKGLTYIGYGGAGKQVRDYLHVDDLWAAIKIQIENMDKYSGQIFNLGGGRANSLSLLEMTQLCREISGNKIAIKGVVKNRPNDLRAYISDCSRFQKISGWKCRKNVREIFSDIHAWIMENKKGLKNILD